MIIDLGLKPIPEEELDRLLIMLERNARKTVFERVHKSKITDLDISIELNMDEVLSLDFEIELTIPEMAEQEIQDLINEAMDKALYAFEHELKKFQKKETK
ncbi:MAG: DUF3194 domain-containing protein [Candidatus Helarchaeota archaeon]